MRHIWIVRSCLCALAGAVAAVGVSEAAKADTKPVFTIYGFAQADYISDFNRVDPLWEAALRPSKIPTVDGQFGSDGQSIFSARQSRFGVSGAMPVDGMDPINFKFEFDMFGTGDDAGQTTIRLRHAYGEWGQLLAGQTNSLFMDGDVFPNVIDYWGPTGMVYLRNPQFRWTPYRTASSNFAIAIEKPGNDIDPGTLRELDPELGAHLQNNERWPDLTAHYYTSGTWGHAQLAGILRDVAYDSAGTPNNAPKGSKTGWGIDASGHLNLFDRDKLLAAVAYGEGIASYMNDGGVDLAPQSNAPGHVEAQAVPLLGVTAYFDHYWSNRWSTSLGYSLTEVNNENLQDASAYHKGEYASVNLLYTPAKNVLFGGELLWGKRTDNNGATGDDLRLQVSVKYDFSAAIPL